MSCKYAKNFCRQKGMSLLEIMVSFTILVITFITLIQAFPVSLSINKSAENATKAAYAAQTKIEELNSLGYDNISAGTIEAKHRLSDDTSNYLYYFQRQTVVSYVDGNLQASGNDLGLKKIIVTVYYTGDLLKTEKTYTTYSLITRW